MHAHIHAHTNPVCVLQLNDEAFKNQDALHSDVSSAAEFLWTRLVLTQVKGMGACVCVQQK